MAPYSKQANSGDWIKDSVTNCAVCSTDKPGADDALTWSGVCVDDKASGRDILVWRDEMSLAAGEIDVADAMS
jgi:hypothetical protein